MAEEEYLIQELRKIESRKKEREKKAQDLQKLIKAADTTTELRRAEKRVSKKKLPQKRETEKPVWNALMLKKQRLKVLYYTHFLIFVITVNYLKNSIALQHI